MPRRNGKKRKRGKSRKGKRRLPYRFRGRRRRWVSRVPRSFTKARKLVRLKYAQQFALNPPAGGIAKHTFRLNSINDPDLTGVGHQPYGRDAWANLYRISTVIGARMRFTCMNDGEGANDAAVMGVIITGPNQSIPSPGTTDFMLEFPKIKTRKMTPNLGSKGMNYITRSTRIKKWTNGQKLFAGVNYPQSMTSSWSENLATANNVANPVFGTCYLGALNLLTDLGACDCLIEIEYLVVLTSPKEQSQS